MEMRQESRIHEGLERCFQINEQNEREAAGFLGSVLSTGRQQWEPPDKDIQQAA